MSSRIAPALALSAVLLTACTTGEPAAPGGSAGPSATEQQDDSRATVSPPDAATAVTGGKTPGAVSLEVSRQLFDSAPVVAVAAAKDRAAVTAAAEAAEQGVPTLLDDGTPAALAAIRAELGRLGARTVLATGPTADRVRGDGVEVVASADGLPAAGGAEPLTGTAVLVDRTGDSATSRAAAATATAAGATVVPVRGTDPRADTDAIAALAKAKPTHVLAAGAFGPAATVAARVAVAATGTQLPGGGQVMFPGRRLVAMYGHPGTGALGVLGEQPLDAAIARAERLAAPYRPLSGSTPVVPAFEIISTVATAPPGPDGNYSFEAPISLLEPWVRKAGAAGMYVVLDLQPGRTDFLTQAKRYEPLLRLPHVGLALDPEWRLEPGQRHLTQIGSVSAAEVNSVYRWLADLTAAAKLPQKVLVLHQFRLDMIGDDEPLQRDRDEVTLLIHMDGQGPTGSKDDTWRAVVGAAPKGVPLGWKNFYDEDTPMLSPAQTMTRKPTPVMISYQ
ncbi:MAG TPA: hypothetical protein VF109_00545 [Mycobacteriales bacterium]